MRLGWPLKNGGGCSRAPFEFCNRGLFLENEQTSGVQYSFKYKAVFEVYRGIFLGHIRFSGILKYLCHYKRQSNTNESTTRITNYYKDLKFEGRLHNPYKTNEFSEKVFKEKIMVNPKVQRCFGSMAFNILDNEF